MTLQLGDTAPDFEAETTEGPVKFHDWIGDSWAVLFSHPKDFTPVCTTELGYMANAKPEFDKRNVFVIGPDKKVKLILIYPMTTGRNFDEVLRVIDSLQLTAKHKVATPVNWKEGEKVIIAGSVSNDEAKEKYPDGWEEPRPYIRLVPQPS
jgi:alkyl hydroperoxide reductase subunit AhpC